MRQIVPLDNSPNQTIDIVLSVDGITLELTLFVSYNEYAGYWVMGVADKNGTLLIAGIPLVSGTNLLGQYAYLSIGSAAIVNATGAATDSPDDTNLGSDFLLVWGDTP